MNKKNGWRQAWNIWRNANTEIHVANTVDTINWNVIILFIRYGIFLLSHVHQYPTFTFLFNQRNTAMKKESHQSVENLLTNESFLSWYFGSSECERAKWNNKIATNDADRYLTEEAASLLNNIIIK